MTLNQLRIFATAARHLNLSKASDELGVSQPTISQQLKILADEFGVALYWRHGRGVKLTEDGRVFLTHVHGILREVDKLNKNFLAVSPSRNSGTLAVGGTYSPSAILLPSALDVFKRSHPKVRTRLFAGSSRSIERKVLRGELELAVVNHVVPSPNLISESYGTHKLIAFAAPDHPVAKKKELSLFDLAKTPLIIRGSKGLKSTTETTLKQLKSLGFKPNIGMRCESPEEIKKAVRKKLGIGILYHEVVRPALRKGDFKPIKLPGLTLEGKTFIIYNKQRPLSSSAQAFLALLRQWRGKIAKV
ncbi:MAG: LysR family transcriptional regulator [Deltaproteobacteria bacterium]|nr:LysR family transcriptional regulator [Deltaproteobacteria bacterium]